MYPRPDGDLPICPRGSAPERQQERALQGWDRRRRAEFTPDLGQRERLLAENARMSAARLVGLITAAVLTGDDAALEEAFLGLSAEEADGLGKAAAVELERHTKANGDWFPWAVLWSEVGRARLRDAGAGFRERLEKTINARTQWEVQQRRLAAERATEAVRRAVRPLMRRGARKAEIEEAAGRAAAGALEWDPDIYVILVEEMDACHQGEPALYG